MALIETQARRHELIYSEEHRKLLGTHYTPDPLVDYIVKRALRPLVDSPQTLPNLRILDPACGSGLFLLKAYETLADHWQRMFGSFTPKDARHILENCLFGIDIDERAAQATRKHLLQKAHLCESDSFSIKKNIVVGDALSVRPPSTLIPLHNQGSNRLSSGGLFSKHSFDCVIGNPPYIRIQNTSAEDRGRYVSSYSTAAGRFDLSVLFIELSEYLLNEKGRLGFIVSNKILSTSGAKRIRTFLLTRFSIEEIVDLGDSRLFDAAILPMILIASRSNTTSSQIAYSSITESHECATNTRRTSNLLELLDNSEVPFDTKVSFGDRVFHVQRFYAEPPGLQAKIWTFHNEHQNRLLLKLQAASACTLSGICEKVGVGLKTTADSIFIKPMTEDFVRQKGLETDLVFPLLESHNINRWTYSWEPKRDLFVLYPHIERNGKVVAVELDLYPKIKKYLEANRPQLESRTYLVKSGRRWYEIWVHQSPSDFRKKKILTPDISSYNRFALDDKGFYVNGTCFYLILTDKSDVWYYSILGLLNSKVIEYFHKIRSGNALYAKRFRYWSSYIGGYPIAKRLFDTPDIRSLIARNVARILNTSKEAERTKLEQENDRLCYKLFELTQGECSEIETTLSTYSPPSSRRGGTRK